jgi:hypothetical protein
MIPPRAAGVAQLEGMKRVIVLTLAAALMRAIWEGSASIDKQEMMMEVSCKRLIRSEMGPLRSPIARVMPRARRRRVLGLVADEVRMKQVISWDVCWDLGC